MTQVHTLHLVKLSECGIQKVFDKQDAFACAFHFWTQFTAYAWELVE
jgi:hypothetical protein